MVADFIHKGVPRSLVRVPGSGRGHDAFAPSVSCDLGRVSSFAASVVIGSYLPTITMGPKGVVAPSSVRSSPNKLVSAEALAAQPGGSVNSSQRRPLSIETSDSVDQESKRPRLVLSSPAVNGSSSPRVVRVNVHPNHLQAAVDAAGSRVGQEGLASIINRRIARARRTRFRESDLNRSFEDLRQEQNRLREENRVLMERLSYYLQLSRAREAQANQPPVDSA